MTYGDLVTSDAHIPQARGPYMVLHELETFVVCVALDNSSSVNIPKDKAKPFPISAEILDILSRQKKVTH